MSRLIIEQQGPIWLVRFHNPPEGVIDQFTATELSAFLDEVEHSDTVRAVVMTGDSPGVFIRHYDVAELAAIGEALAGRDLVFSLERVVPENPIHTCMRRIESLPVPFIAAINGIAMGGGLELALACDIRLVQNGDYDLGLPEVNIGLLPGAGGTQRLTRLLGETRALAMMLTGMTVSPTRAADIGLVAECVDGDVMERAVALAEHIASLSPRAIGHIKQLVRGVAHCSAEDGLAAERTLFCDLMVSPEGLAAMRSMVERGTDIRDTRSLSPDPSQGLDCEV